jgi:hypothetical protein
MPRDGALHGAHAAVEAGATALGLRGGISVESRDNGRRKEVAAATDQMEWALRMDN